MKSLKGYMRNERGSQLIEFMAVFPMIIMALLFIWQVALVAYTVVVAESAARDGARVAAVGGDYGSAVDRAAHGLQVSSSVSEGMTSYGEEVTVTVKATVPTIKIPLIGRFEHELTADASMPKEEEED
ncbi:TadE/TadG family type IV pilus assembly protein [Lederbergia lenta]|uniref:TadE/TadG family type IV pilus assembly protein n=1 Tax=Lederbergia lenta TaxID=1467 RepID=UPI002040C83F|nr:TadE/TadG family type IV pilus assembly protein [Lederbergia lenta]MCM3113223.1 pilus assembly protein [Lederbergia lenta]